MFLTKGFNILSCQFYHLFQLISKFVQISSVFLSIGLVQYYNVLFRYSTCWRRDFESRLQRSSERRLRRVRVCEEVRQPFQQLHDQGAILLKVHQ